MPGPGRPPAGPGDPRPGRSRALRPARISADGPRARRRARREADERASRPPHPHGRRLPVPQPVRGHPVGRRVPAGQDGRPARRRLGRSHLRPGRTSIGLHQRDIGHLLAVLGGLRDKGNSVVVVEHDPAVILKADHVIDMGPGAGRLGGRITFEGPPAKLRTSATETGRCLRRAPDGVRDRRKPTGMMRIKTRASTTSRTSPWTSRPGCSSA